MRTDSVDHFRLRARLFECHALVEFAWVSVVSILRLAAVVEVEVEVEAEAEAEAEVVLDAD